jgi:hypothetical protein
MVSSASYLSMPTLNLSNVEELVFHDRELQSRLPDLVHEFQQWRLGFQVPSLRFLGKKAVLDALVKLGGYTAVLEEYFGEPVEVEPLDYHVVKNFDLPVEDAENELCKYQGFPNLSLSRREGRLYISCWR